MATNRSNDCSTLTESNPVSFSFYISGGNGSIQRSNSYTHRVPFIRDGLISSGATDKKYVNTSSSLKGLHLLEVGCGAGILTEQLARIHATMTSIDPGSDVIDVAQSHVQQSEDLARRITYLNESIELHCIENKCKYDAVIVSEVLEHVNNKAGFLEKCVATVKVGECCYGIQGRVRFG